MKNFLPYKESITIKEIGFDEPCLGHWTNIDNKPEFSYNEYPAVYISCGNCRTLTGLDEVIDEKS